MSFRKLAVLVLLALVTMPLAEARWHRMQDMGSRESFRSASTSKKSRPVPRVKTRFHAIVAADTRDKKIGRACADDAEEMLLLMRTAAEECDVTLKEYVFLGKNCHRQKVERAVRNLRPGPNDTVLFFYSGHGMNRLGSRSKWPLLSTDGGKVDFGGLCQVIQRKGARFTLCLSDCCNNKRRYSGYPPSFGKGDSAGLSAWKKLFLKYEGNIAATAALPGEVARTYSRGGSVFTVALLDRIESQTFERNPSWRTAFSGLESDMLSMLKKMGKPPHHPYYEFSKRRGRASQSSEEQATPIQNSSKDMTNSIGMKLVWIPAGSFKMGSLSSEAQREDDEGPVHRVTHSKGFWMGTYEVTQKQWRKVMGSNPSHRKGNNRPVENVSWNECQEFCRKLSAKEGYTYRLPTEAEWEYACRGGTTTPFAYGRSINSRQTNFDGSEPYNDSAKSDFQGKTLEVGSFSANTFGLYDMHGNVREWCQDWYSSSYYRDSPARDPQGPKSGKNKVRRGGSYGSKGKWCRAAYRGAKEPDDRNKFTGFRVVRSSEKKRSSALVSSLPSPSPGKVFRNSIGMKLVWVPSGSFMMGTIETKSQPYYVYGEQPRHRVTLSKGFWMGVYEVTQAEWRKVMGSNPSKYKGSSRPVDSVSWNDCQKFLDKLSVRDGRAYRLPTEAEWEYACRAGTTTPYHFGRTITKRNAAYSLSGYGDEPTVSVGSFRPNDFGLYDMHGNVNEWCQDYFRKKYSSSSPVRDPQGPSSGDERVLRGGSASSRACFCRSASRNKTRPGSSLSMFGFRVVCDK